MRQKSKHVSIKEHVQKCYSPLLNEKSGAMNHALKLFLMCVQAFKCNIEESDKSCIMEATIQWDIYEIGLVEIILKAMKTTICVN